MNYYSNEMNEWTNGEKLIKCAAKVGVREWALGSLPFAHNRHAASLSVSEKSCVCSGNMFPFSLFLFPSCLCSSCLRVPDLSLIILLIRELSTVTESTMDQAAPVSNVNAFFRGVWLAEGVTGACFSFNCHACVTVEVSLPNEPDQT